MTTKKLNSGVVTAISDTDLVAVCDAGGSLRPILFANLRKAMEASNHAEAVFSASLNSWITIADGSATASWGGILTVTSGLWAGYPAMHVFAIGGRYKEAPVVSSLLGPTDKIKLRIVEAGGRMRIDVKALAKRWKSMPWASSI